MARTKKVMVTLFKGGTNEKTIPIDEVHIPDLWHIAQKIADGRPIDNPKKARDMILDTWHTAAWLRKHIQESQGREAAISELLKAARRMKSATIKGYEKRDEDEENEAWHALVEAIVKVEGRPKK
jgi:hypothetical protein